jgi:hypothetical protein
MTVTLHQDQIALVQRFMVTMTEDQRERFMCACMQILDQEPSREFVIAAIGLALDTLALPVNAEPARLDKETQMT